MRALVFAGPGRTEVRDVPEPELRRPDDVLIEIEAAGICGTDLHILEHSEALGVEPGMILGHEFIGRVSAVGAEPGIRAVGDRVAVEPNSGCGVCDQCKRLQPRLCPNIRTAGISYDGGLAERIVVPAGKTIALPEELPTKDAVLVELLASVGNGFDALDVKVGDVALVLGAGPAGLLFTQLLKGSGCTVVVSEPAPARRESASRAGADAVLEPGDEGLRDALAAFGVDGAEIVIDCVGGLLGSALELARPAAQLLVFGMSVRPTEVGSVAIAVRQLSVHGRCGSLGYFPHAIRWLTSGVVRAEGIVTAQLALEDLPAGFEELKRGEQTKIVYDASASPRG